MRSTGRASRRAVGLAAGVLAFGALNVVGAGSEAAPRPVVERPAPAEPAIRSADLTVDGFDRYRFSASAPTTTTTSASTSSSPVNAEEGGSAVSVSVSSPEANHGRNLRTAWWVEGDRPSVDQESCVTWSEYSGPIVQAGVALRIRRVGGHTQAVTVTNNIMWGARNGWNVHLWNGGSHGTLIGQAVLSHSFGSGLLTRPPLPWRMCARVVGSTVEFKAWSLAAEPVEPAWSDPGFGTSFMLPRGWVYPGVAGWYVGHLRPGDTTVYRSLHSETLTPGAVEQISIATHTVADGIKRGVAQVLVSGLRSAV